MMISKSNPVNEASLEHGLIFCLKLKAEGKNLDDLINHLKNQLKIFKKDKFDLFEKEIISLIHSNQKIDLENP